MKDRIRYSEAFKLKVMEELRDAKWKSVQEAVRAYGIAEMSVYNWMHKLGFEHLKGRLIYVRTRTELDRIKELEEQVLRLKQGLADEVLDHKIDVEFLKIACQRAGTSVEDLKKEWWSVAHVLHEEEKLLVSRVCRRCGSNGSMGSDPIEARLFPLFVQPATGEFYASPPKLSTFSSNGIRSLLALQCVWGA